MRKAAFHQIERFKIFSQLKNLNSLHPALKALLLTALGSFLFKIEVLSRRINSPISLSILLSLIGISALYPINSQPKPPKN